MLVGVAIAMSALTACSGGDDTSSETTGSAVRQFREVQASDITFEGDPSDPSRGIFRVTTTEPMICAIVWGTDDSYGRFNNSLSMNGTGISEHDVLLPDIEAGQRYRYIVQGTSADGTLFRSEPATFTIEPDVPGSTGPRPSGPNLALDSDVVDVSSEFSSTFAAANAVDGATDTEWATAGDGDNGFIELDLGATFDVGAVEFVTRSMADGSAITSSYTVILDGGTRLGPFPAGTIAAPRAAEIGANARRIRFEIAASSGGNVGAVEIRVYPT